MPGSNNTESTRRKVLGLLGTGATLSLAGCIGGDDDDDGDDPNGDDDNGADVDRDFIASLGAEPDDFDPTVIADATSNSAVGTMCYEGLVDFDFDIDEVLPALATDWTEIDDQTWQFELREGVEFHNGDEFVAEDIEFSIERMRNSVNAATVAPIENVEILGDYEVEITWSRPHAPVLVDISGIPILPHDADDISEVPEEDDFPWREESIGTGPWTLESYQPEDRVELNPFEDYWHEEENPWETVTLRIIPEQVSQEEAMHAGEVDMIDNPAPFDLDQWDGEDAEPIVGTSVGFDFVSFPVNVEPYDDPRFRRGMTRLIPRDAIIEAIFGGNAVPLGGPISPGLGTYWDEAHEQDLLDNYVGQDEEAGLDLIEAAIEDSDLEPPIEVDFITNVNRTRERWMEQVQTTMDATEFIDANLDIQDFSALVDFLLDPEGAAESRDVVGIGWTGGSDPDGHVESLLHSDFHVPGGFNWNLYANDEVDDLIEAGQTETTVSERVDIYHELQEVLAEEVPSAYMWTGDQIDVVDTTKVSGWEPYPNSSLRYWALYRPNVGVVAEPA